MQDSPSSRPPASPSAIRWLLLAGSMLLGIALLEAAQPPDRGEEGAGLVVALVFAIPGLLLAAVALARAATGRTRRELRRVVLPVLIPSDLVLVLLAVVAVVGRLPAAFTP